MSGPTASHLRAGWAGFRSHRRVFLLAVLVLFGTWLALELAVAGTHRWGLLPNLVLHLAFLFLFSGLLVGIESIALQVVDGSAPRLGSLFERLERGPSFLLALCLYLLGVACGLVLLVAPGIYLAVRYAPFGYVLASRKASGVEALREAAALTRGRWWEACRFFLLLLALNLAGAALLGLGLLVSFPVSLLAAASYLRTGAGGAAALDSTNSD